MGKSFRRVLGRWIWFSLAACALLETSCERTRPPDPHFSVGIADSATLEEKTLTLYHVVLISNGFLVTKELPPEEQLKGKVLLQVVGMKRATQVSAELGTALHLSGAPHDSPEAKSYRERHVTLSADDYDLTQFSAEGEPRDIFTVDIDLIIVEQ
jgi:hypothetical protein